VSTCEIFETHENYLSPLENLTAAFFSLTGHLILELEDTADKTPAYTTLMSSSQEDQVAYLHEAVKSVKNAAFHMKRAMGKSSLSDASNHPAPCAFLRVAIYYFCC